MADQPTQRFDDSDPTPTRQLDDLQLSPICPRCGGRRVVAVAQFFLHREVPFSFRDWPFQGKTLCEALVCVKCGYTELYASEPTKLLAEHEQP
jgi:predicted nucleic-acid-binding Zn-ribbon protein